MRELSEKEKRTIRVAIAVLGIYFAFFAGQKVWALIATRRAEYTKLVEQATNLRAELQPYQDKVAVAQKLMEASRLDPGKLSRTSLVAEASSAILKAATIGGIQLGPMRESAARQSGKELTAMQLDC